MSLLDPEDLAALAARRDAVVSVRRSRRSSCRATSSCRGPQTDKQRAVEARIKALGSELARHQGMTAPPLLRHGGRHGGGVRRDERRVRPGVRREPRRSGHAGAWPTSARRRSPDQFIMDMHTHFLRDDTRLEGFVRSARGGRQGRLEPGARRQAADARGSEVRQLLQGNLLRQRHQGRADLRLGLGRAARLVPHQRDEGRSAREGEPADRLEAHVLARDLHARPARLDGRGRPRDRGAQARLVQGLHGRRQHQQAARAPSVAHGRREAALSVLREAREGGARERLRAQGPVPAGDERSGSRRSLPYADVRDVGKAAKDWPQLNFIIYHSAFRFTGGRVHGGHGAVRARPGASTG